MSCCGIEEEEEDQRPEPTRVRGCTDTFWLCIFIAFWCLMIMIAAFALVYGDPMRLISGYDSFGNTCGMNNEMFGKMELSGQDTTEKPETLRPPRVLRLKLGQALRVFNTWNAQVRLGRAVRMFKTRNPRIRMGLLTSSKGIKRRGNLDDDPQSAGAPKRKTQPLVISDHEDEVTSNCTRSAVRPTPAQDIMKEKIAILRVELDLTKRRKGSLVADGTEHEKTRKLRWEIDDCEKKLKSKEKQRVYAMKHRDNKKQRIIEICEIS